MRIQGCFARLLLLVLFGGLGLVACSIPPPPARQPFRATDYFQGKALELAQAVDRKDGAAIRHLIKDEGVNPDTIFDQANMPMVAWPIINQNFDGLRLLLDNGANPNARKVEPLRKYGKQRNNAMVFAAGLPDQRYLKLLLDRGGDPNTMSSNNEQLTYVATLHHVWPNVQLLIERGANINQPLYSDDDYNAVMSWYSKYADFEEVYWLLQHGADPTRKIKADPGTPNYGRMPMVEDIYYADVIKPDVIEWQRKCQHWLRDHGIQRTNEMGRWARYRQGLGHPYKPEDIPLL